MLSRLFKFLFVAVCLATLLLLLLVIETKPQMAERERLSSASASDARAIMQRTAKQIKEGGKSQLSFSQKELKSLSMLANNLSPNVSTDVQLNDTTALFLGYIKPFTSEIYLNFSLDLLESQHGLLFGDINLGSLTLDGQWLFENAIQAFSHYLKPEHYELLDMVQRIDISPKKLQVDIDQGAQPLTDKGRLASLLSLRNPLRPDINLKNVQAYYDDLLTFSRLPRKDNSLLYFLKHQFAQASEKTTLQSGSAAFENRDAMMALALYFGSNKFTLFTGALQPISQQQQILRNTQKRTVTLLNRNDLQKHFVYSMALQLLSDAHAGFALGEFKELLDANQGGSGFSFIDLYADRAGTRLAQYATQNEASAIAIQQTFAAMGSEDELIPFPRDLPEGIDATAFSADYVDTRSAPYRQMLALIDEQLSSLHFYAPLN